ncbi:TetR/AcrR family transcriptional regulator [Paenibacillus sepulcri]|uniref:TetR/AcrR family transcriptional regulator n=1 Tax=Paenibacillus sepulcri TaxID=359917 RepID=A0ABS7C8I8_9BACL|nr:TetR/AcrR family transcriptional regulator [Paenibacillus sepulcri]
MAVTRKGEDRRIQRTCQLIRTGFVEIMREKGFAAVTIQDIADRANVNRGTFYIHYTDKYMLLDEIVRDNFGKMLTDALPPDPNWDKRTLQIIILTVLSCFEGKYRHQQPSSRFPALLLERTIKEELENYLIQLIKQDRDGDPQELARLEARVQVINWAIFGAAIQWGQEPVRIAKEQMADAILSVIVDGTIQPVSADERQNR